MNHIGVGKSPLASRNRLRYIPPSIHRNTVLITYGSIDFTEDRLRTITRRDSSLGDHQPGQDELPESVNSQKGSMPSDGILTLLSTTYSLLVLCFFKSLLDRIRPRSSLNSHNSSSQTSRQNSALNLSALKADLGEELNTIFEDCNLLNQPLNVRKESDQDLSSSFAEPQLKTSSHSHNILPDDLFGPSIAKNHYTNLYESMFEVDSSDDEAIDLTVQYGTSISVSRNSNYIPNLNSYDSNDVYEKSLIVGHSVNRIDPENSVLDPFDTINTISYVANARKSAAFGSSSFILPSENLLNVEPSDEYDRVVSRFYTPFKPVPHKEFSLTDAIMASIPSTSLSSFLRRERECIQDLILNERKAKLSKIHPLSAQQLNVVQLYWQSSSNMSNTQVVSAYSIDITVRDLGTLCDGRWLNDNVIDFYLNMVSEKYPDVYCWTTHFFSTLKQKGYQGVARWAKRRKVNVTEKNLVVVPINIMSTHWAMSVIDNKAGTISYYDSLASNGNSNAVQLLQQYMLKECERLQVPPREYTLYPNMKTPQQLNGFDCGVFSCTVAKFISGNMPLSFTQNDMKTLRRRMAFEIIQKSLLDNASSSHL